MSLLTLRTCTKLLNLSWLCNSPLTVLYFNTNKVKIYINIKSVLVLRSSEVTMTETIHYSSRNHVSKQRGANFDSRHSLPRARPCKICPKQATMAWTPAPTAHFNCNSEQKVTLQINSLIQHRCPRFISLQQSLFFIKPPRDSPER